MAFLLAWASLHQPHLCQNLVVLAETDDKEDCGDIIEAVNPLFSLRPLSADVENVECQVTVLKLHLDDSCGGDPGAQHVLVRRLVARSTYSTHVGQEVVGRVE